MTQSDFDVVASPLVIDTHRFCMPERTRTLLFVSDEVPPSDIPPLGTSITLELGTNGVRFGHPGVMDPSTIFTKLPLTFPGNVDAVPVPGYFPRYVKLTPEQRWIYLNWLCDISKTVPIGYVFVYFYGLERHLVSGLFDSAFAEIELLRAHHPGPFLRYSDSALIFSCIMKHRGDLFDRVKCLEGRVMIDDAELLIAYEVGKSLSADSVYEAMMRMTELNRRYLQFHPKECDFHLRAVLRERYGSEHLPLAGHYNLSEFPKRRLSLFCNWSLPPEVQSTEIPDFFGPSPFTNDLKSIHAEVLGRIKGSLRASRRKNP